MMATNTNPHNFSSSQLMSLSSSTSASSSYHDTSLTIFPHYQLKNSAPTQTLNHVYSDASNRSLIFKLEDLEHSQLDLPQVPAHLEKCEHIERKKKKRRRDDFVLHPPLPLNFPYHNDSLFLPTAEPPSIGHFSQSSSGNCSASGVLSFTNSNDTYPGKSLKRKFSYNPRSGKSISASHGLVDDETLYERPETYNQNEYEIHKKPNLISKMLGMFRRRQRLAKKRGGWFSRRRIS